MKNTVPAISEQENHLGFPLAASAPVSPVKLHDLLSLLPREQRQTKAQNGAGNPVGS